MEKYCLADTSFYSREASSQADALARVFDFAANTDNCINYVLKIKDNYPKYVITADYLLQQCNGIQHVNLMEFMRNGEEFQGKRMDS